MIWIAGEARLTEAIETAVKRAKISAALFGNREPQEVRRSPMSESGYGLVEAATLMRPSTLSEIWTLGVFRRCHLPQRVAARIDHS
jgi:hypothetical protein